MPGGAIGNSSGPAWALACQGPLAGLVLPGAWNLPAGVGRSQVPAAQGTWERSPGQPPRDFQEQRHRLFAPGGPPPGSRTSRALSSLASCGPASGRRFLPSRGQRGHELLLPPALEGFVPRQLWASAAGAEGGWRSWETLYVLTLWCRVRPSNLLVQNGGSVFGDRGHRKHKRPVRLQGGCSL